MRQRHLMFLVGGAILIGGALAACGSDSGGPSGVACTGNTPDLAGTWTLDSIQFLPDPTVLHDPEATGSFLFTGDSVYVALTVPSPTDPPPATFDLTGAGKCTLTATKLNINGTGLIGQASGTYTFVDVAGALPDTLHASLLSTGQTIRVVVTR
jgi:hypothetical protein